MSNNIPVLLTIFNRPEKTRRVVEALRQVKPLQMFVAADGPRLGNEIDLEKCNLARQVIKEIDWPCDLKIRFSEVNVGCDPSVSSAITWFFEHVEYGVILEDDCILHPDFFRFCEDIFNRYKNDLRIMQISSFAPFPIRNHKYDYHFSRNFRCGGGWGTWRRAWLLYSQNIDCYKESINTIIRSYYPFNVDRNEVIKILNDFISKKRDNWDFKWNLACYAQNALCIVPEKNLMNNIGFDPEGTHTVKHNPYFSELSLEKMPKNFRHPDFIYADIYPEIYLQKKIYSSSSFKCKCVWHFRSLLGLIKDYFEILKL